LTLDRSDPDHGLECALGAKLLDLPTELFEQIIGFFVSEVSIVES
jgi:hypothetical protein